MRTRRALLGHAVVTNTMSCTRVLWTGGGGVRRPMDSNDRVWPTA